MPPPPPRRSLRPRRKTVAQLLARAKATATPEETEAFWNAADKDDAPFDANELSDTGEVRNPPSPQHQLAQSKKQPRPNFALTAHPGCNRF